MKKIYFTILFAAAALTAAAQVQRSELAGKYHFQGKYNFWEAGLEDKVYAHDDFTFSLEEQKDGTFRLYNFFYNGMDEQFQRLGYGATAEYSPAEQLLYVYQTPWLWDEYMGHFMESYGYGQGDGPMLYFLVQKDPKAGTIKLSATENSLGFYYSTYYNGQSSFVYAIDYPGVVTATQLKAYPLPAGTTCEGSYTMSYTDYDGRQQTTSFTIAEEGGALVMSGMFGDKTKRPVYYSPDRSGIYMLLDRPENGGYYTAYFGSNVGDCRVSFSYDADGNLVSDNYFSYSPDFKNWTDAFDAVATRTDHVGIDRITASGTSSMRHDLSGRRIDAPRKGQLYIENGRKRMAR